MGRVKQVEGEVVPLLQDFARAIRPIGHLVFRVRFPACAEGRRLRPSRR